MTVRTQRKKWKEQVNKRYFNICQICYKTTKKKLPSHHIIPLKLGGTDHISNGITLCHACHIKVHKFILQCIKSYGRIDYISIEKSIEIVRKKFPVGKKFLPEKSC